MIYFYSVNNPVFCFFLKLTRLLLSFSFSTASALCTWSDVLPVISRTHVREFLFNNCAKCYLSPMTKWEKVIYYLNIHSFQAYHYFGKFDTSYTSSHAWPSTQHERSYYIPISYSCIDLLQTYILIPRYMCCHFQEHRYIANTSVK